MVDNRYLQRHFEGMVAHVVEECGEILAAAGKLQRWGPHSTNPLIISSETNIEWLYRELLDGHLAIQRLITKIEEVYIPDDRRQ